MERKIKRMKHISVILFIKIMLVLLSETASEELFYCPEPCSCHVEGMSFIVDCSKQELKELPTFISKNVQFLDLSKNLLTTFPEGIKELQGLEVLDLSWNIITTVPGDSLNGLSVLRILDLSHNLIANWIDLNPNSLLLQAFQLRELSLAGNKLSSFTSMDEKYILVSNSLEVLDLSQNNIAKISGEEVLQGLTSLRRLSLRQNPILSITDLVSSTLLTLDLSDCGLGSIKQTFLSRLPLLNSINLSRNPHLTLMTKDRKFVYSSSLRKIDLTLCNQESIQLAGFENLTFVNLSHNMIKELRDNSFASNSKLEGIELSMNMIGTIHSLAFSGLNQLQYLDLSFNSIQTVDRNLFKGNKHLSDVNFSYNYINRLSRLNATSVNKMNLSHCEIFTIERNALADMKGILELDLSYNILPDLPPYLESETLQGLNLKNNRIVNIRNTSFMNLPSMTALNLVGNRLTTPFKRSVFNYNPYLQEIWLGDNPWVCDCGNKHFHDFYRYLMEPPRKAYDLGKATCYSPETVYGLSWESACYKHWYPHDRQMGSSEMVWVSLMSAIIFFGCLYCIIVTIRNKLEKMEERRQEAEREENESEAAAIARQTRMRLQQEAQLNAPDPRDTHPPSYEDAIRMPKPFFYSMDELSTTRKQKRRKRGIMKQTSEDSEEVTVSTRQAHQFHSEEILSSSHMPPRLHPFEMEALERNRVQHQITADSPPYTETDPNLREEILVFSNRQTSPYSRRRAHGSSKFRRPSSSGSIYRSKDSFQRIGSLKRLSEKPEPHEGSNISSSASSLSNNFVDVKPNKSDSAGSSRLEMTDEASKFLEEEMKLLEEMDRLKKQQSLEESSSDSDSDDIEVIRDDELNRGARARTKVDIDVHRRGSNFCNKE